MNIMNTKSTTAIVGALVGLSLVTNAVMAQQAEASKPRQKFQGPVKVFILAGQSNMEGHGGVKTLDRLGEVDPLRAQLVELRYFGGLTIEETAVAMEISPATAKRHWQVARAWLFETLSDPA